MSDNHKILEYFKNIELDTVTDPYILQNIHTEISLITDDIILDNKLSYKLETMLTNSSYEQLSTFLKSIKFNYLVKRKLGSRIIEKIISLMGDEIVDEDVEFLVGKMRKRFVKYFINENATYTMRKIFVLIGSRAKNDGASDGEEDVEKGMVLESFKDVVIENLDEIMDRESFVITLQTYLENTTKKQEIIKKIFINHFEIEDLKSKRSRFYEFLLKISNKKNLDRFSEQIKEDFLELCGDRNANYIIQELIKSDTSNINKYLEIINSNLSSFNRNSNIIFNLIITLALEKEFKKASKLITRFYLDNEDKDIFKELLYKDSDDINGKYVKLVEELFNFPEKYNHKVIVLLKKYFNKSWLYENNGRALLRAFFSGNDDIEEKERMVYVCRNEFKKISTNKFGVEMLEIMSQWAENKCRKDIEKILRNRNRQQ